MIKNFQDKLECQEKNHFNYKIIKSKENFPGNAWPNNISKEMSENLKWRL